MNRNLFVERILPGGVRRKTLPDRVMDAYRGPFPTPGSRCWPTKDVAYRDKERLRWEQCFPAHQTVLLEGAGHYMQEDAPDEIVAAIRSWRRPA